MRSPTGVHRVVHLLLLGGGTLAEKPERVALGAAIPGTLRRGVRVSALRRRLQHVRGRDLTFRCRLARRCRDSMRHQGVAGSPPPAVLIPQDVRNVVREPASHALGQRGLSARSAAADTRPSYLTVARLLAAPRSCMAGASILGAYQHACNYRLAQAEVA